MSYARVNHQGLAQKTVMVVYGTRPEAIKVAPLIKQIEASRQLIPIVVVTGQHREMLDQVNEVFNIRPDFDLDLFQAGQSLNDLSSRIFESLNRIYNDVLPDAVVVQGDTTSVMAAAISAFYCHIPVIHLEAGLRSHNIDSPFPEELNRKLVSQAASLHLAPTSTSMNNLYRESVLPHDVVVTGNTVIDALLHVVSNASSVTDLELSKLIDTSRRILLVTTHRRENWGSSMENVGRALARISQDFPNDLIILPAHRNPIVREAILPFLESSENVITMEPLPYHEFALLLNACHMVLTDSGGIQEEAPTLGKPVLVLRDNTERPEAVDAGTVKLIGTDENRIVEEVSRLKLDEAHYASMANAVNPYGDGHAAERSVAAIEELLGVGSRLRDFDYSPNAHATIS